MDPQFLAEQRKARGEFSSDPSHYLDHLFATGADRQRLAPYVLRAKKLHAECGCALSGAFASIALITLVAAAIVWHASVESPIRAALLALAVIFLAGLLGKGLGISIARIRLRLLYQEIEHVYLH